MTNSARPFAIYYEHPDWFRPLFAELDRRQTPYVRIDARRHRYDPGLANGKYSLWFNRMSPSAYLRGAGQAIFYTLGLLDHLESTGTRVVNGQRAFRTEISKALQLSLLRANGLPSPKTRVINDPLQAPPAAEGLRFPVIVKPNIGGSGAGVARFDTPEALALAAAEQRLELGIDQTALVQEFIPARGGYITRVEVLGGKFLYAIRVYFSGEDYNLCPADICQTTTGVELVRDTCPVEASNNGMRVEGYTPPPEIIDTVERIMAASGIEVGGVEYIIDDRDGSLYYYDINALSNFVADASRVVGFDPFVRLADYLEQEARL
jgi:glutathione synthase/RimK-type ligase-like ATP-grasp enzyme